MRALMAVCLLGAACERDAHEQAALDALFKDLVVAPPP